ncbi:MAG: adenylate kinase [Armatimonadetes bacterium]|nr:adenylate kinase [Armatimonadota bacterium]
MRIVLIGPPGVGKGTQSELLTARRGAVPLSSGAIFRSEIEAQTDLGNLAKRYIDQGRLVPNGVTIEMMAKRMRSPEVIKKGYILDGFPRTVDQAKALDLMLEELDQPLDGVVSIEVDDEEVVTRLSGRMGCTKCGAIYHQLSKPPKRDWICDNCNSPLFVRNDDKPETIRERLNIFHENTKPVIDYYVEHGLVRHIDGSQEPDKVYQDIEKALGLE